MAAWIDTQSVRPLRLAAAVYPALNPRWERLPAPALVPVAVVIAKGYAHASNLASILARHEAAA